MSLNVFQNNNLEFDVSLIKLDSRLDGGGGLREVVDNVIGIDQAAILNLEIKESSLSMGAAGSITINNKFKILERLDITTNSPNDLYIAIKIRDVELDKIDISTQDKEITLIGLINNTNAASASIIDNVLIFYWEEAFVASMKKTQARYFDGKGAELGLGFLENLDVVNMSELFNEHIYKLKSEDKITVTPSLPNTIHNIKVAQEYTNASVYDILQVMLKETRTGTSGRDSDSLTSQTPYFRFVNVVGSDGSVKRKLKFDAYLSDRHIEFIEAVAKDTNRGDFSDVYLEKFQLGPFAESIATDPNTSLYNKIEQYDIVRADIGKLRKSVWGDYAITNIRAFQDIAPFNYEVKTFANIQSNFIIAELRGGDYSVNLPIIDQKELNEFTVEINTLANPTAATQAEIQQYNKLYNKVFTSFLTINETITFTVKGKVYRKPNKFIWIERGVEESNYKKLWYVNSVNHIFRDGQYNTEIIATKIFGDTTPQAIKQADHKS